MNAFSWRGGSVTPRAGEGMPTYSCATSLPARRPVFRTRNETVAPIVPSRAARTRSRLYLNYVYDSPKPNGNTGAIRLASYQR